MWVLRIWALLVIMIIIIVYSVIVVHYKNANVTLSTYTTGNSSFTFVEAIQLHWYQQYFSLPLEDSAEALAGL